MKKKDVIVVGLEDLVTDTISTENTGNLSLNDIQLEEVNLPDFASLVPEEEAAEDDPEEDIYAKLREKGCFSPVRGMVNIQNVLNDSLYAKIYTENSGARQIVYCQKYKNAKFSRTMSLPQSKMMLAERYKFQPDGIHEPSMRSRVKKFVLDAMEEYDGQFSGEIDEKIEISDILNVLYAVMPKLPVEQDKSRELSVEEFYKLIVRHVEDIDSFKIFNHKSYYMLDEEGIDRLAYLMGMKRLELLANLRKHGFLYQNGSNEDKNRNGYQANIRLHGNDGKTFTQRFYCIYKLRFLAGIPEAEPEKENETSDF